MTEFINTIIDYKNKTVDYFERLDKLECLKTAIKKISLTAIAGGSLFLIGEGIVRIPFLKNSKTYLPLHPTFIFLANGLRIVQDTIENTFFKKILREHYTGVFDFCVGGPITEELGHRLLFQEIILKQSFKHISKKIKRPVNPDGIFSKILRVGLSSLVFAAQHRWAFHHLKIINPYGAASLVWMVVLGTILGGVQELTGNTIYPIAIHIINNTMTEYLT